MVDQADEMDQSGAETPDGAAEETPMPESSGDNVDSSGAALEPDAGAPPDSQASAEETATDGSAPDRSTASESETGSGEEAAVTTPDDAQPAATWNEALAETEDEDAPAADEPAGGPNATSTAHPADFPELGVGRIGQEPGNINLLMDVKLPVSIELGRTRQPISEILQWGQGSIVELDKLAGEPVNLLVNDKLVAKGEVVVVDENFGLRITSLVAGRNRDAQR